MRTFRPGATIWPFFFWTLIAVTVAYFAERHALLLPGDDRHRWVYHLLFCGCLVLGPLAFLAHFLRSRLIHVTVSPNEGLILSGGRRISWSDVRSVDHREAALKGGLPYPLSDIDGSWGYGWIVLLVIGFVFYYVFFPVLCLLSPWHPRVALHLRHGDCLVFRDLADDEEFVALVRRQGVAAAR